MLGDLRDQGFVARVIDRRFDEIYQLAADLGGAGYLFTGENDADVMHNSATINLNVLQAACKRDSRRRSAARSPRRRPAARSRSGAMASRPALFSISMNASRRRSGSCARTGPVR